MLGMLCAVAANCGATIIVIAISCPAGVPVPGTGPRPLTDG